MSSKSQNNVVWVYVENGVVKDRVLVNPTSIFYPSYASMFIEAPSEVDYNWSYDGNVFAAPVVSAPSPEELNIEKSEQVRAERNRLLSETDFVVLRAYETKTEIAPELAAYRQALRDVPQQPGFPTNVVWPQKP